MTSLRHNNESSRSSEDLALDAARASILAVGWSRTTLTDIARRAGLSRMTLYRRWPEMNPIVHEGYRRSLIRRFPYAIFCAVSEATVTIYAVFHTSRDPDKWRQRLS